MLQSCCSATESTTPDGTTLEVGSTSQEADNNSEGEVSNHQSQHVAIRYIVYEIELQQMSILVLQMFLYSQTQYLAVDDVVEVMLLNTYVRTSFTEQSCSRNEQW